MHLLLAERFTFHEFHHDYPPYAILSHTWSDDEVTIDDILRGRARSKKGFQKIWFCARQELRDWYRYIWVDTCNIMKTSSAELSEAINSMYQWYKKSKVCYAYLEDVEASEVDSIPLYGLHHTIARSRWFTRGWTLQELLAPKEV